MKRLIGTVTCTVLAVTLSGCGSARARVRDHEAHLEPARRDGKLVLTAEVQGDSLVATLTRQVECRDARPNPRGAAGEPAWRTCGATPVPGESLVIEFADLAGTTGADGRVVFERGAFMKMLDANSAGAKAFARNLAEAHVRLDVPGRADLAASDGNTRVAVDLSTFLPQWEARRIAQQDSDRSQGDADRKQEVANRAQEEANRRQALLEANVARDLASVSRCEEDVTAIEGILGKLEGSKQWGEGELAALLRFKEPFADLVERLKAFAANPPGDSTVLKRLDALKPRATRIVTRGEVLQPRMQQFLSRQLAKAQAAEKQAEVAKQQRNSQTLASGRQLVLSKLRAPSTARFSGDAVLLECASGFRVTAHDVDAQNVFGAMVRSRMCVKFNTTTRRVIVSRSGDGVSIDSDCSGAFGTVSPMVTDCKFLDEWTLTAGF